jgi:hypothetical protein
MQTNSLSKINSNSISKYDMSSLAPMSQEVSVLIASRATS